jgi:hypothetical protein
MDRYLHFAIEGVFDIANHFVSFFQWREPANYRDLLLILAEHEILPQEHLPVFQKWHFSAICCYTGMRTWTINWFSAFSRKDWQIFIFSWG